MRLLFIALACLLSISLFAQGEDCINPDDIVVETYMYAYSPSDVSIDLGQTITWINTGGTHDVNGLTNSITAEPFDNPESFSIPATSGSPDNIVCLGSYTFTVPGVYSYDCSVYGHASLGMTGTITVGTTGCNDMTACNYSPDADFNDGSCLYPIVGYDCEGNCLQDLDEDDICDACEEFVTLVIDCECEFFDPATYTVFFTDVDEEECLITEDCYCECINDIDNDGVCDENEILGCNLIEACNYDSSATDNDGSCVFVGDSCDDGDPYTLDDVIQENCECGGTSDPTWKCFDGTCYELDDGTGDYNSLADCEAECQEIIFDPTWKCFAGECVELDDGNGEYTSLADCAAECIIIPSWDCILGDCVDPEDGSGFYLDLSDCESECQTSSITEQNQNQKKLVKITNLLGQKTSIQNNTTLLFIYDDGSVEKKFIVE